ncbi:hypothetical protein AMELA_G00007300 [Ameiurus melas]|uniref:RRM domain-containing protein n=1 Tax=Ameiurus melas TaxID=219545 RepID=A0A7J6BGB3_AMEME|nr:hypothetical protein AMELA_G00007300 [Ameiurus melas]
MEAEEVEPSTVPTPTPLTWAQIVKQKKIQPEEVKDKKEKIKESREQKMQAEVNQQLPDKVKKFPTLTPLTGGEIMEAKEAEPSTIPTPTPLIWAQSGKQEKKQPEEVKEKKEKIESREQKMRAEVNQHMPDKNTKQPEEVKEKKEKIESREQKMQAEVNQQLPDKTKKLHMETLHRKKTKSVELFIKNLDYSVDDKRLHKGFLPFGAVISAKVVMENGCSRGFGFVSYSTTTEAMEAIKGMNGKMLGRRMVYVALSKGREEHKPFLAQTEQKMGSSRPTNPRQSCLSVTPTCQERK